MDNGNEVTMYDLARKLNISIATVSRGLQDDPVVSKKTKKKITELAEQLGYRSNNLARNLRTRRTQTIGVIVPRLKSYFMSTVIAGIESVANDAGYNLIISQSSESAEKEKASAKMMFNNRVDGLLVSLAYDTDDLSHLEAFTKKNIPVLLFDRVTDHKDFINILIDNKKAAYEATRHLISQGCRKIVHITAPAKQNVYIDRLEGYKKALSEHRMRFLEDNVIIGNLSQEAGAEAAEVILKMKPLPDAVFAANDNCAVGCMLSLKQAGIRIPEQIAFVGFNNDPVSKVIEPNLTTINYPGYEMGEVAARNLINHLNGVSEIHSANTILLRSEFIERESPGNAAGFIIIKKNPILTAGMENKEKQPLALVTGGGSGIGLAIAKKFTENGIRTIILGRDPEKLNSAKNMLGPLCEEIPFDLDRLSTLPGLVNDIAARFGRVTILVNNAGVNLKKEFTEVTDDEFQQVLLTNVTAVFALSRELAKQMLENGSGSIINISSMASQYGIPKVIAYTASKSAIEGMTRSMAVDLSPKGIRVNCIAPGFIETEMSSKALNGDQERMQKVLSRTPMGMLGRPEDIAEAALFFATDSSRFVTGVVLPVDGGNSIGF